MGYTHYFKVKKEISQKKWDGFIEEVKKIYKNLPEHSESSGGYCQDEPLFLSGCARFRDPKMDSEMIWVNGSSIPSKYRTQTEHWYDQDPGNLDHETFGFDRKPNGDRGGFCKTARKPYDLFVQAVLILARKHFTKTEFEFSSDGYGEEWLVAYEFVSGIVEGIKPEHMKSICGRYETLDIFKK